MNTKWIAFLVVFCLMLGMASGCSDTSGTIAPSGESIAVTPNSENPDVTASEISSQLKSEDSDSVWYAESSTQITLNGGAAEVSGVGASVSGGTVTITQAGTYVISGTLTKGQILINAGDNDDVRLVLNGVDITADQNAAIYAASADKLIITLADGKVNTVTDSSVYSYADTAKEEPNAAIFSKCDLSINGTGSLTVNGNHAHGVATKDDLVIAEGTIFVSAVSSALRGKDSVTVLDGVLSLTSSGGDGISTNNTEETDTGWILIQNGDITINAYNDGIQADTTLQVDGGTFNITSGGSTVNSSESYKGLKTSGNLIVNGGIFTIDSADDSIHANGNITISGGEFSISSGDDGIHADGDTTISGGKIIITKSYEGIEGANINITNGAITITSSDDGINAAGGNDGGIGGMFGEDRFASSGAYSINVSGGEIVLTAGGDGFDSNGSINISSGRVVSLIQSSADNGAMDCDGGFTVTGGTIIYGGTGVGQVSNTAQSYVFLNDISAGTEVRLEGDGKTIASFTPEISCRYLVISTPEIVSGQSYTGIVGTASTTVTAGTGGGGMSGRGQGNPGGGKQRPGG